MKLINPGAREMAQQVRVADALQRSWVQVPAPTWLVAHNCCNSSSGRYDTLFWLPWEAGMHIGRLIYMPEKYSYA